MAYIIREARASADLTQVEVAKKAGTSQPALARYESGASQPTLPTLERILAACGKHLRIEAASMDTQAGPRSVRGMLDPKAALLRKRRARLLEAAERHGARRVRVFGSVAQGQATDESDVDLLIELEPGRTLLDLVAFQQDVEAVLGISVDVTTTDMLKDRVRERVLSDALPL